MASEARPDAIASASVPASLSAAAAASGRKYRSKKQRPCDLCRSRKIHCKVGISDAVCECCRRLKRVCTFEMEPLKRRHRPEQPQGIIPQNSLTSGSLAGLQGLSNLPGLPPPLPVHTSMAADGNSSGVVMLDSGQMGGGAADAAMALDMGTPFWLSSTGSGGGSSVGSVVGGGGGGHGHDGPTASEFFSPRGLSEMEQLLLQSPLAVMAAAAAAAEEPGTSPCSGTEGTSPPARSNSISISGSSSIRNGVEAVLVGSSGEAAEHETLGSIELHALGSHQRPADSPVAPWVLPDWPQEFSLEGRQGYSNHYIGLSGEADPFLLRFYEYNGHDLYTMFRLDYRRMLDDATVQRWPELGETQQQQQQSQTQQPRQPNLPPAGYMPVQFAMTDEEVLQDGVQEAERLFGPSGTTEADDIALVRRLVPADVGERLVRLYCRCVHPRFPVLALEDLAAIQAVGRPDDPRESRVSGQHVPVGLLSAVYALAMPFSFLDDELSLLKGYVPVPTDELWAVTQRSHARTAALSHLSLLQLSLLLLQRPPYNDAVASTADIWSRSCAAVAVAETLGVNCDPSAWRLPRREAALRRRLWWLTYAQHVWHAVGLARPCHLHADCWDVAAPAADDLADDLAFAPDDTVRQIVTAEIPVLLAHWRLSVIAADVLKEFYTFRSVRESASLSVLLSRAQPLRSRIESWRQTLPLLSQPALHLSEDDLVVGASLRLAHLTLEVLIFRALLRPLLHDAVPVDEAGAVAEPMSTIYDNCYTCAKVGMEIVASMKGKHFAVFWPCYVRYQLCYISSFILLSLAQSPTRDNAVRNRDLLNRWRDTLRMQARAWPLARLATIRLDAIYWKGLPAAVLGVGSESPAVQLLRENEAKHM
ncbi:fungal specific transcription factor domain containing protein [Grosmannia clavigera kw1407]|uniref:Fungal specific transcription factor domain containing protein n=1 Tax=Grosmannia clavigera (strain kw1407 / UAMH 11150) TaxID=655863 RepID=F0XNN7_GROCL|nr:fungal specific transcription factor domain containing protein [Grosmannia clavigera kw1407]EFX00605.1 fungal specific transcription factor domain containing protein [Grosmannia clavigera kw1407]